MEYVTIVWGGCWILDFEVLCLFEFMVATLPQSSIGFRSEDTLSVSVDTFGMYLMNLSVFASPVESAINLRSTFGFDGRLLLVAYVILGWYYWRVFF